MNYNNYVSLELLGIVFLPHGESLPENKVNPEEIKAKLWVGGGVVWERKTDTHTESNADNI